LRDRSGRKRQITAEIQGRSGQRAAVPPANADFPGAARKLTGAPKGQFVMARRVGLCCPPLWPGSDPAHAAHPLSL
jgi:hypothetical protein